MKVQFIAPQVLSIGRGGMYTQIMQTARFLPDYGVEVAFFNQWSDFNRDAADLFHIFRANMTTYEIANYLHDMEFPFVISPVFFTRHGTGVVRTACMMERLAQRFFRGVWTDYGIAGRICEWSRRTLPNTTDEGFLFEQGMQIPKEKITIIPNGVEERFYHADPTLFIKTYGLKDFILCVAHVGLLRKNVLALIRAAQLLDYPLVVIGQIFDTAYGKQCVREAQRSRNIHLIGAIPNDSPFLESAYAACSVFALPSQFETPGIAALEAGLAGAKVVITSQGGTKEYFREKAIYVEYDSVESIRQGLVRALEQTRNDDLRDHIHKEFLWQRVAEKTAAVYREIGP